MEYQPATLPKCWPIQSRAAFSNSPVQQGYVLLFSQDGSTITGKLPDGSFVTVGGKPTPYVLFVSNDSAFNGNYIATSDSFNGVPVYELTQ